MAEHAGQPPAALRRLITVLHDLRFAVRSLRRHPGFAVSAIATLAVGIGAVTAIFTTVNAALLRPLPFPHPEDLFAVYTPATDGRFTTGRDSGVELARLNDGSVSILGAAGSARVDATIVRDDNSPIAAIGYGVTDGFFDLFGIKMAAGRAFTHDEHAPRAASVVILSDRFWRDRFGGDSSIVGKPLRLVNGPPTPPIVVGIAPRDFDIPRGADFWLNFAISPQSTGHGFDGYLRIKPGTNLQRLESEMAGAMAGIARDYGMLGRNRRYEIKPLVTAMVGDLRPTLIVVLVAAALLLALACVNVTNLLLARGTVRAREMAVRVALGAGRARIMRQLLTESLVLAAAGTALGLLLAFAGLRLLVTRSAADLPRLDHIGLDARVLLFVLAVLIVTGLVIGFAPALRLAGSSLKGLMNEGGRSSTAGAGTNRMLKGMIVAEIALAITLVAGAGWLVKSFANLDAADPGFVAEHRLVFDLLLPPSRIFPPPGSAPQLTNAMISERLVSWTAQMSDRLQSIGGVKTVATTATLPLETDRDGVLYIGVQGEPVDPEHPLVARAHRVSDRFFEAMGVRMIAGRSFTVDDRATTAPVAIVNRTFARRYLASRDPLTARFTAGYPDVPAAPVYTVVGVVDDIKYVSMGQAPDPAYYTPAAQSFFLLQTVVVDTTLDNPLTLAGSVRSAMKDVDPLIPVTPRAMTDIVARSLARQRLGMLLMMLFAVAALGLAAIGIYGVIAYASAQRVGEIATRMALGATSKHVFWMLMKQGRVLAIVGTAIGLAIAYAAGRGGSSLLYEVRATDPLVLATATALVAGITLLATLVPAIRGSRVEPSRILRLE